MRKQNNIRILELLRYLYLRTDEEHPATIADMLDYLKGKGLQAVRQTVYGDLQDLIAAGIDVAHRTSILLVDDCLNTLN